MLREYSSPRFTEFIRDGGFMKYQGRTDSFMEYKAILINKNYGISKKDNWNPADIWLIKRPKTK